MYSFCRRETASLQISHLGFLLNKTKTAEGADAALGWASPRAAGVREGVLEGQAVAPGAEHPLSSDTVSHSFALEEPKATRMGAGNKAFLSA